MVADRTRGTRLQEGFAPHSGRAGARKQRPCGDTHCGPRRTAQGIGGRTRGRIAGTPLRKAETTLMDMGRPRTETADDVGAGRPLRTHDEPQLQGEIAWDEEVVKRYKQYTVTDLSGDTYAERSRLADTLLWSSDPHLSKTGHELLIMMDHMGSREQLLAWYNLMSNTLMNSPEAQQLASRYVEVDVQQILAALRSFPLEIGREWLTGNYELFAHRLYYGQIPRTDVLKLFSLIILYTSACRRVQSLPVQPTIGVNLGGSCQMNVDSLTNSGTMINIEQAEILPQPNKHKNL